MHISAHHAFLSTVLGRECIVSFGQLESFPRILAYIVLRGHPVFPIALVVLVGSLCSLAFPSYMSCVFASGSLDQQGASGIGGCNRSIPVGLKMRRMGSRKITGIARVLEGWVFGECVLDVKVHTSRELELIRIEIL